MGVVVGSSKTGARRFRLLDAGPHYVIRTICNTGDQVLQVKTDIREKGSGLCINPGTRCYMNDRNMRRKLYILAGTGDSYEVVVEQGLKFETIRIRI